MSITPFASCPLILILIEDISKKRKEDIIK
jgi:hypothetical protein